MPPVARTFRVAVRLGVESDVTLDALLLDILEDKTGLRYANVLYYSMHRTVQMCQSLTASMTTAEHLSHGCFTILKASPRLGKLGRGGAARWQRGSG